MTVSFSLRLFGLLCGLANVGTVWAASPPVPGFEVAQTIDAAVPDEDGSLKLPDGRQVRLAGIEIPVPRARDRQASPLVEHARQALAALVEAAPLTLWTGPEAQEDRWGRLPALVTSADGRWIQAELLRQGLARVSVTAEDEGAVASLLVAEAPAREAKAGLWADPRFALRRSDETPRLLDTVQVVEGTVTSVNAGRNAIYLNLGEDRRRNLGVRITRRLAKTFAEDPAGWTGRRVRVRGFIGKSIGPLIDLAQAGQIEQIPVPETEERMNAAVAR